MADGVAFIVISISNSEQVEGNSVEHSERRVLQLTWPIDSLQFPEYFTVLVRTRAHAHMRTVAHIYPIMFTVKYKTLRDKRFSDDDDC
jgi:hypothetical protein